MSLERSEGNDLDSLSFTWANGKQNPVLVNSVRESRGTNRPHLPKKGLGSVKLVSKTGLKKWNTNFP